MRVRERGEECLVVRGREKGRETAHLEVAEEGVHEKVEDDERRENGVDDAHQDEAASQSVPR